MPKRSNLLFSLRNLDDKGPRSVARRRETRERTRHDRDRFASSSEPGDSRPHRATRRSTCHTRFDLGGFVGGAREIENRARSDSRGGVTRVSNAWRATWNAGSTTSHALPTVASSESPHVECTASWVCPSSSRSSGLQRGHAHVECPPCISQWQTCGGGPPARRTSPGRNPPDSAESTRTHTSAARANHVALRIASVTAFRLARSSGFGRDRHERRGECGHDVLRDE